MWVWEHPHLYLLKMLLAVAATPLMTPTSSVCSLDTSSGSSVGHLRVQDSAWLRFHMHV